MPREKLVEPLGRVVEDPKTLATAIRIGNPASWQGAIAARDESGGTIDAIDDDGNEGSDDDDDGSGDDA